LIGFEKAKKYWVLDFRWETQSFPMVAFWGVAASNIQLLEFGLELRMVPHWRCVMSIGRNAFSPQVWGFWSAYISPVLCTNISNNEALSIMPCQGHMPSGQKLSYGEHSNFWIHMIF
jgi:hypothetical protein